MKTRIYTTAMLMAMFLVTVSINAQTTRRSTTKEQKERVTASRSHTRSESTQKARTTQSSRQVHKQQVQRQRTTQPARQVQKQQVQRQRATQPARQVQKQQVQRQQATQPARQVQKQQVQRQRTKQPARQVQKQQVQRQQVQRIANTQSGTSRNGGTAYRNAKSNYRKADSKVYVKHNRSANTKVNKYSTRHYYGGNHYHYAYPTRKVKFHYHHDTYVHNYHVLYYPTYNNIYWTRNMYRDYRRWYPHYTWRYKYGYSIQTMSVFDTKYNLGEVAMVYGRVYATWHNKETDDFLLFFGGDYPYQQFTVVLPGNVARRFSWRPERYFLGEHMTVTGLITTFDGIPEIVVKNKRQVGLY